MSRSHLFRFAELFYNQEERMGPQVSLETLPLIQRILLRLSWEQLLQRGFTPTVPRETLRRQ